jgi:hypothetical protein
MAVFLVEMAIFSLKFCRRKYFHFNNNIGPWGRCKEKYFADLTTFCPNIGCLLENRNIFANSKNIFLQNQNIGP